MDDFVHLFFLYTHRGKSVLVKEILEESGQFRTNLKESIGLFLTKTSVMRVECVCRDSEVDSRYGYQRYSPWITLLLPIHHKKPWTNRLKITKNPDVSSKKK